MASRKEYEMLFALEAQLGREFRSTFAKARGEFSATGNSAESFGSSATQAVDALSGVLAAAGISAILSEIKDGFIECAQASMDFETAITGVAKTTDLTDEELADMSDAIKDMSTRIPATTEEIAAVAEAAGQLGIQKESLLDFTEVMTMLGTATNMTAEDAATALARFANITGMSADNYDRLGAVIVDLGNNFATTESEITQMGTRLASGGKLAGLTEPQIMALAAAMSSVGIEAEAGGTAMTQTLNAIEKAVAAGEDSLQGFADVAGMSADEFAQTWETDALGALTSFIRGLGELDEQGDSAVLVLEDLGLTGIRQSNMLKSLALAADEMDSAVQTANTAWEENVALTNEANKRYATTQSKLDMMQNAYNNLKVAVGDVFNPALGDLYETGTDVLGVLEDFVQANPGLVKGVVTFAGVVGTATAALTAYAAISKVIKALDMATMFGGMAGPIMLGVTAAAALAGGIVAIAEASKNDAVPSVKELTEAARELDEAMSDAKEACADTVSETEAAANVANRYVARLEDMNAVGELNDQQQSEFHGTLVMLTQTIPELTELINLETDEIDGGTDALYANIEAWRQRTTVQAYQEQLNQIYAKNSEVVLQAAIAEVKLADAQEALQTAQEAQNDEFERQNKLYQEANQKVQDYYEETGLLTDASQWLGETTEELNRKLEQAADDVWAAQDAVDAYQKAIDKDNEALEAAKTEIETAERAVRNLTEAMDDGTGAANNAAQGQEELNAAISGVEERVAALAEAYTDAYTAAYESIHGQYSLWSEVDETVATSAGTINTNLEAQISHWQSYNENLASLRERAGDIEGLTSVIGSFADGSTDSVNAIAGMAAASDEDLRQMVESWKALQEEQEKTAESVADFQSHFSEQMGLIQSELEDDVAAMDLGSEAEASGRATIQGFISGAEGMLPLVQQAYARLGNAALSELYRNNTGSASSRRISGMQRYASGTTSAEAGIALVGEEGPEIVMMNGGETVLNAADTRNAIDAMTVTSDSDAPIQVNFNIGGNVDERVMDRLELYGEEFAEQVRAVVRESEVESRRGRYA